MTETPGRQSMILASALALLAETTEGSRLKGLLAADETDSIVLRRVGRPDLRIPRQDIGSLQFENTSLMPAGLLEELLPQPVSDLFAYLSGLRR